ncbi:PREDICTED: uncharacterized protein LOC109162076 [Ipomoea nil]|uniref:uncharacterized protein LOC109162076 n=1 Tax=Ipomoea nil TaxID=35883 RepID=UPI000901C6FA|nr:PREDICTED: uncharacterized protein LOC109162076 [Ipomoea nil]
MQKMRAMLAFIQFCVFFFIIGSRLPLGFSKLVSADYLFRELSFSVIITPRFVFVLGNAIVIILVLKSGNSLDKDKDNNGSASSDNVEHGRRNQYVSGPENKIRRSQSEKNMARVHRLKEAAAGKELRRQATFTCRKIDVVAATNEMSNEEFRRRVEAFIARQQRSLREEEFSSLLAVSCES